MTRCTAQKFHNREGAVTLALRVKGHANYAENGKDIVCSAVSCLCISLANMMMSTGVDKRCVRIEDGGFYLSATISENVPYIEGAFDLVVGGLQSLAEQYPDHVSFTSGVSH